MTLDISMLNNIFPLHTKIPKTIIVYKPLTAHNQPLTVHSTVMSPFTSSATSCKLYESVALAKFSFLRYSGRGTRAFRQEIVRYRAVCTMQNGAPFCSLYETWRISVDGDPHVPWYILVITSKFLTFHCTYSRVDFSTRLHILLEQFQRYVNPLLVLVPWYTVLL